MKGVYDIMTADNKPVGNIYRVISPEDGTIVPLTCTQEQFRTVWEPKGYVLAPETGESIEPAKSKSSRKTNGGN